MKIGDSLPTKPFNGLTLEQSELLSLLAEECAEIIQVAMKIQRHGLKSCHPDVPGVTNEDLLTKEIGDAFASFTLLTRIGISSFDAVRQREAEKLRKVGQYLHHHVTLGSISSSVDSPEGAELS